MRALLIKKFFIYFHIFIGFFLWFNIAARLSVFFLFICFLQDRSAPGSAVCAYPNKDSADFYTLQAILGVRISGDLRTDGDLKELRNWGESLENYEDRRKCENPRNVAGNPESYKEPQN